MIDKLVIVLFISGAITILAYGLVFRNLILMFLKSFMGGLLGGIVNEVNLYISDYNNPSLEMVAIYSICTLVLLNSYWLKFLNFRILDLSVQKQTVHKTSVRPSHSGAIA